MHKNFTHKVKVYYEDTDAGGVVYYGKYLNFLERARTEAISNVGLSNKKIKKDFDAFIVVKSCNIEYKRPAHLEDELNIRSFVKSVTKASFQMTQIITREKDLIAESQVHLVFVNHLGKIIRIPNIILENFKPYFCESIKT
jgi:acyl-CoA thioester hydrolase